VNDYEPKLVGDPRATCIEILSDALIGLKSSVTVTELSGTGGTDVSALIRTDDGRAFTLTVRREYQREH